MISDYRENIERFCILIITVAYEKFRLHIPKCLQEILRLVPVYFFLNELQMLHIGVISTLVTEACCNVTTLSMFPATYVVI